MDGELLNRLDRAMVSDLYLSRSGLEFLQELVDRFGSRFGGSAAERAAADFIQQTLASYGLENVRKEAFECSGWVRRQTKLFITSPREGELDCIALPFCPPGTVEGPLVFLGDGDPQNYEDNRERLQGAIAMVTTSPPRYYHRSLHRGEKLGRALEAGAIGFIWMRDAPGGLPETGSARFAQACEVPAISVSYETGHEMLRRGKNGNLRVRITSDNELQPVKSYNVVGELPGQRHPEEIVLIGGHYDGHDISQSAYDNGAGVTVILQAARALAPHRAYLGRTVRFVTFAQEEMGLIGSENYVRDHADENHVFMLNVDCAGRGGPASLDLQGWPEAAAFFRRLFAAMHEEQVSVGDQISLYSDMYHFAAAGFPAAAYASSSPASGGGAPRGFGHTYWDSLDKIDPRGLQLDAIVLARLLLRLSVIDDLPLVRKTPQDFNAKLRAMGLDEVLRYERRPIPGC